MTIHKVKRLQRENDQTLTKSKAYRNWYPWHNQRNIIRLSE
uniref:Uncharacterized protein n=1 Tax=Arundo donax TaxID=35708 RepID=A0A0A8YIJ0_ARUDO